MPLGVILPLPLPTCDHPQRYTAFGGWTLCEPCAREASGWKPCRLCKTVTDQKVCPACLAEEVSVVCPECDGEGECECSELDCHGEYCEDGWIVCYACGGHGTVPETVAHPKRIAMTINTGGLT